MVRVTKQRAIATRRRILNEAAKLFRKRGFSGVSVADVMKSSDLTHGGFYGHFGSKEDLMAESCGCAVSSMLAKWERLTVDTEDPMEILTRHYLSHRHLGDAGTGCLMAALGPDVSRQTRRVRRTVTECLGSVLHFIASLTPGGSAAARRRGAIDAFASMVGALVIARAINDPKIAGEVLRTVAASIAERMKGSK